MTDAEVLAAIQAEHLSANVAPYEGSPALRWDRAWLDQGGTIFGPGPYAKVPVELGDDGDEIVIRVYPPERLRKRLAAKWVSGARPGESVPTKGDTNV